MTLLLDTPVLPRAVGVPDTLSEAAGRVLGIGGTRFIPARRASGQSRSGMRRGARVSASMTLPTRDAVIATYPGPTERV